MAGRDPLHAHLKETFGMHGGTLRRMAEADLAAGHALTEAQRWPHRLADWHDAFRHGEGWVAQVDGRVVGTTLRWRWGPRHATVGLVVVDPALQGRGLGAALMGAALEGLDGANVLLHATVAGLALYERLGFVRTGELHQHQGTVQPAPLVPLPAGMRLRPAVQGDLPALAALDTAARGMPRPALIEDLVGAAEAAVVLDHGGEAAGFGLLRRFGRGLLIGPVVAPGAEAAHALVAHLAGRAAGRFLRIDVDPRFRLADLLDKLGLAHVDAPIAMWRGTPPPVPPEGGPRLVAVATQALA